MTRLLQQEYERRRSVLEHAMHELPAGVVWQSDAVSAAEGGELLDDLERMVELCKALDIQADDFIAACRWHLNHHAHFHARQAHFASYEQYVSDCKGPLRVPLAPRLQV
ncbi:MAG TPA: hypothetical protein VGC21_00855 [Telluria sp.]|jgi:hypothetical protein